MHFQSAEELLHTRKPKIRNQRAEAKHSAKAEKRNNTFTEREVIKHERTPKSIRNNLGMVLRDFCAWADKL